MSKLGDKGVTFIGKRKLSKTNSVFSALGDLDELSCFLGLAKVKTRSKKQKQVLEQIQKDLIEIGGVLAGFQKAFAKSKTSFLKSREKELGKNLKPLKSFVLPGRSEYSSILHLSRAVCRRVERNILGLRKKPGINITSYLNQLSRFLFTLSQK